MKFSSDSIKLKSKAHNEDFCFDLETPRGQFFAVLDFGSHDFANLNATLTGKLETIVGSFVSLSRFSAELFLGFLAKEINNFLHNLGEQSGGPELLASGALCLVNGNRLTYFLCGDVQLIVVNDGRLLPLNGTGAGESAPATGANVGLERLGARNQEAPLTDAVQSFTLQDADLVLLMTRGLHEVFAGRKLAKQIAGVASTDPEVICEALMKASASASEDRSLVVMGGPYEKYVDPVLADLSRAVAALETRIETLSKDEQAKSSKSDERIAQQLEVLRDDLRGKAAKTDLQELDERVKALSGTLLQKAKSGELMNEARSAAGEHSGMVNANETISGPAIPTTMIALLVLAAALIGSVIGGWMQSRSTKPGTEVWSVKTAGNQIIISRLDGEQATVTLDVAQPLNATGEQRFSSFADAKRYIDTVVMPSSMSSPTGPGARSPAANVDNKQTAALTEIELKQGETLQEIAERYNITLEKLMSLNPRIRQRTRLQIGQKVLVPTVPAKTAASIAPPAD